MNEQIIEHIENELKKDTAPHHVGVQSDVTLPDGIHKFLAAYQRRQESTVKELISLAEWMERMADDCRNRAATINQQCQQIPEDIRHSVLFEVESRSRCEFLSSLRK